MNCAHRQLFLDNIRVEYTQQDDERNGVVVKCAAQSDVGERKICMGREYP